MTLSIVTMNGARVEGTESRLGVVIRRHRVTRQKIDWLYGAWADCDELSEKYAKLEKRLAAATDAELRARSEVLSFPVNTLEDMVAKAIHLRSLLTEGDDGLDKYELDILLHSLTLPTNTRSRRKK